MSHHYTRSTESDTVWCDTCKRRTVHAVSDGRLGRCTEHAAPLWSKKQQRAADRRAAEFRQPKLPGME